MSSTCLNSGAWSPGRLTSGITVLPAFLAPDCRSVLDPNKATNVKREPTLAASSRPSEIRVVSFPSRGTEPTCKIHGSVLAWIRACGRELAYCPISYTPLIAAGWWALYEIGSKPIPQRSTRRLPRRLGCRTIRRRRNSGAWLPKRGGICHTQAERQSVDEYRCTPVNTACQAGTPSRTTPQGG